MITAKELFDKMTDENDECTSTEMMIEFAQRHVTEALKMAYFNHHINLFNGHNEPIIELDEDSILDSYSTDNIK
jgi:hypothetical protein